MNIKTSCIHARNFEEYWDRLSSEWKEYPDELIQMLQEVARHAWRSGVISSNNAVMQELDVQKAGIYARLKKLYEESYPDE